MKQQASLLDDEQSPEAERARVRRAALTAHIQESTRKMHERINQPRDTNNTPKAPTA